MRIGSFPAVKCGRGMLLTTHPLLVLRSWKSRATSLLTLWVTPGLQRGYFTFLLQYHTRDRTGEIILTEWREEGYPNKFHSACLRSDLQGRWQKKKKKATDSNRPHGLTLVWKTTMAPIFKISVGKGWNTKPKH